MISFNVSISRGGSDGPSSFVLGLGTSSGLEPIGGVKDQPITPDRVPPTTGPTVGPGGPAPCGKKFHRFLRRVFFGGGRDVTLHLSGQIIIFHQPRFP